MLAARRQALGHASESRSHFPDAAVDGCAQVSAGYDAHWRDPLAGLQMRTATFHRLAAQLHGLAGRLCGGRLVLLLEGGYDLRVHYRKRPGNPSAWARESFWDSISMG